MGERGYSGNKDAVRKRLRRVEGVRGLERGHRVARAVEAGGPDAPTRKAAAAIERLVTS